MKEEILIAGYGGQGVVVAGSLLANSAIAQGLETCGMVSYGAEMRGGAASSTVIISDSKIGSPVVVRPDTAIIMNEISLNTFEKDVKQNGLIIVNISECKKKVSRKDVKVIEVDATKIAVGFGNIKAANFVMLGAYLKNKKTIKLDTALNTVRIVLPRLDEKMLELNKTALLNGYGG
jgi:2-oxoglutarate ferredoxin oxidoreductase subunit gamma